MKDPLRKQARGISGDVVDEMSGLVSGITGVQLGERQHTMVASRMSKRISALGLHGEEEYAAYFNANRAAETDAVISLLTTHHTYFFRESSHFEYLIDRGLAPILEAVRKRADRTLRILSAACSRGQEVYSLAMLLATHMPRLAPDLKYEIVGTDVDAESVAIAKNGVYHRREIKTIPATMMGAHWSRGSGEIADYVRAKASLRDHCRFEVQNLMNLTVEKPEFDVIFCRNVFIYFTPPQIREISQQLLKKLHPHGLFFVGISESLTNTDLPVNSLAPSVYEKKRSGVPANSGPRGLKNLRVFCVDDSPTVLALLKKILTREEHFEIVGTAIHGRDAAQKLKNLDVDLITLDIHMPEQSGVEYLQTHFTASHPPVVMISSVMREDATLAMRALELGASDYVEKPALNNLEERGEEIRLKLRSAWRAKNQLPPGAERSLPLDRSFSQMQIVRNPENCLRVFVAGAGERKKLIGAFRELNGVQPACVVLFEGAEALIPSFAASIGVDIGREIVVVEDTIPAFLPGQVLIGNLKKCFAVIASRYHDKHTSICVFGQVTEQTRHQIFSWNKAQILLEDTGEGKANGSSAKQASDIVPHTSFSYLSTQFFGSFHE